MLLFHETKMLYFAIPVKPLQSNWKNAKFILIFGICLKKPVQKPKLIRNSTRPTACDDISSNLLQFTNVISLGNVIINQSSFTDDNTHPGDSTREHNQQRIPTRITLRPSSTKWRKRKHI